MSSAKQSNWADDESSDEEEVDQTTLTTNDTTIELRKELQLADIKQEQEQSAKEQIRTTQKAGDARNNNHRNDGRGSFRDNNNRDNRGENRGDNRDRRDNRGPPRDEQRGYDDRRERPQRDDRQSRGRGDRQDRREQSSYQSDRQQTGGGRDDRQPFRRDGQVERNSLRRDQVVGRDSQYDRQPHAARHNQQQAPPAAPTAPAERPKLVLLKKSEVASSETRDVSLNSKIFGEAKPRDEKAYLVRLCTSSSYTHICVINLYVILLYMCTYTI